MSTNVIVPPLGDSVTEAVLLKWHKRDGEQVNAAEPLCELETEKANVDVPADVAGVFKRTVNEGSKVRVGQTIGTIDGAGKATAAPAKPAAPAPAAPSPARTPPPKAEVPAPAASKKEEADDLSPAVRRILEENGIDRSAVTGTGPGGRILKEDVIRYMDDQKHPEKADDTSAAAAAPLIESPATTGASSDGTRREPMSKLRKKIAERLVNAQQTAAILTTFNEIDLQNVMDIRAKYKEKFEKTKGVGLGFMSFFAKAVVLALKEFPKVNGQIDGDDIVYHDYVHLGIAVSTDRGLAVPVLRNAHSMSFAKIESEIKRLATATRDGKLSLEELSGGTFTITNGGVFGSLLSTPILNPPQSGILGMHTIQKRPVVINDKIEIRPMMYVALSYDHRLIDGRESVSFLVRIKELLEDPSRLLLEI
jgi:2-oxoglutarate dehydrogenase E2 component (dihydrolipoamide succinyltransferase)